MSPAMTAGLLRFSRRVAVNAILPPEPFQRWHHIVVKTFDAMVRLITHLQIVPCVGGEAPHISFCSGKVAVKEKTLQNGIIRVYVLCEAAEIQG